MCKVAAIILAAGASSRMEDHIKQVLPWGNATLLEHAVTEVSNSKVSKTHVILGANFDAICSKVALANYHIVYNKDWAKGLGSSIATGVSYIMETEENYDAVLIALADQPLLSTTYFDDLLLLFKSSKNELVSTNYGTKKGVPAIFGKRYFSSLATLDKDNGASEIIKNTVHSSINGQNNTMDIDTWDDYKALLKMKK